MEQYSEQSRKPSSQQWILKKAERCIYHCCIVSDQPSNLLKRFLLITLPYMRYDIDIYTQRTTKLFTPIIKSFVAQKVLIQNERTRWFMVQTLRSAFVQGIVRVGYSPPFFYYELLLICNCMALLIVAIIAACVK